MNSATRPTRFGIWFSGFCFVLTCLASAPVWSAPPTQKQVDASVEKAIAALEKAAKGDLGVGRDCLVAYTLLKGGNRTKNTDVRDIVNKIVAGIRNNKGVYKARDDTHATYVAGIDLMLLEAYNSDALFTEIEAIKNYLLAQQDPNGSWDYPKDRQGGDTSQCQYALLGLWSAARAGADVPMSVWDRAAQWHVKTQAANGIFLYRPLARPANRFSTQKGNGLLAAGIGSMSICRLMLFPNGTGTTAKPADKPDNKFGVLEKVDIDNAESEKPTSDYKVTTPPKALDAAIAKGINALSANYREGFNKSNRFQYYYFYALERAAALTGTTQLAGRNWFGDGAEFMLAEQDGEGHWKQAVQLSSKVPATTCFSVLFLTRATRKIIGNYDPHPVGGGLLIGGRGFPDDLSRLELNDGQAKAPKMQGPLDELLSELEKLDDAKIESAQAAIVEKVQIGDPNELIKQKDRIIKLAKHPHGEIRRTAVWAIGHTSDFSLVRLLIDALDDEDLGVIVEARNGLCTLSRLPNGLGLAAHPDDTVAEDADEKTREVAATKWKKDIRKRWKAWYLKVRPYNERDDLFALPK